MAAAGPSTLVPATFAAVARGVFRALSAGRRPRARGHRGARIFHPDGIGFAARVEVGGAEAGGDSLLGRRQAHPAIVRLSKAVGLPGPIVEPLGIALRLVDARGPGRHQDLLFVSSGQSPLVRHALLPGLGGFFDQFFSTLLPYSVGGRMRMLGLSPVGGATAPRDLETLGTAARGRCYRLCVAGIGAPWLALGQLEIGARLPDELIEDLRFNPWNTGEDLRPLGPLMGARDAAYRGSQRGRLPAGADEPVAPAESNGGRRRFRPGDERRRAGVPLAREPHNVGRVPRY